MAASFIWYLALHAYGLSLPTIADIILLGDAASTALALMKDDCQPDKSFADTPKASIDGVKVLPAFTKGNAVDAAQVAISSNPTEAATATCLPSDADSNLPARIRKLSTETIATESAQSATSTSDTVYSSDDPTSQSDPDDKPGLPTIPEIIVTEPSDISEDDAANINASLTPDFVIPTRDTLPTFENLYNYGDMTQSGKAWRWLLQSHALDTSSKRDQELDDDQDLDEDEPIKEELPPWKDRATLSEDWEIVWSFDHPSCNKKYVLASDRRWYWSCEGMYRRLTEQELDRLNRWRDGDDSALVYDEIEKPPKVNKWGLQDIGEEDEEEEC
ncbi:hypothetical protein N0V85_006502 [Neurospora sp. IMI 360204]|nr:hypothetical protein N0V85_006502 [Neurospora sp. IMI 360204]